MNYQSYLINKQTKKSNNKISVKQEEFINGLIFSIKILQNLIIQKKNLTY